MIDWLNAPARRLFNDYPKWLDHAGFEINFEKVTISGLEIDWKSCPSGWLVENCPSGRLIDLKVVPQDDWLKSCPLGPLI